MKKNYKLMSRITTVFASLAIAFNASAQLTGIKNIPGDYVTITAAVTDLNTQGVGPGGVTFNIIPGYTETITAPISITATGSAADPIIFQRDGMGTNPVITAYVGTATPTSAVQDGIWNFVGSDYISVYNIDLQDNNTTNPATMEYGFGFYKASATNGCQNNLIQGCTVSLSRNNNASSTSPAVEGSRAINMMNATLAAQTTVLTITAASGSNSNNKFYNNTVQNCNYGFVLIGYADSSPFANADMNNEIGGSISSGNIIQNFGGATGATNPSAGIRTLAQYGLLVTYNTVNNNNGSGVNHVSTLRGIYINTATSASVNITYNTVTVNSGATTSLMQGISNVSGSTAAGNTVNISNNLVQNCTYTSATSGDFNAIVNTGTAATVNVSNNTVSGNTLPGTGTLTGIDGGGGTNVNITNNTVINNTKTGASGTLTCIRGGTSVLTFDSNIVNNNGIGATSGTSSATVNGLYSLSSPTVETFTNNSVTNLYIAGSSTSTSSAITGITTNSITASVKNISNNQINSLQFNNSSTGAATVSAINTTTGTTISISKNKIYNLLSSGASSTVSGIILTSGATVTVSNNIIGDLKTPSASAANPLMGINITSGVGTANVYYNTIQLFTSSTGTNFGSSAIFANVTPTVDLKNNIFINASTASGTGLTVAYRRSGTSLTTYATSSNSNDFYAGAAGASNLIFYDGTNSDQTLAAFKTRVAPRESSSVTADPVFLSTSGSSSNYLHIDPATSTILESGGVSISGITTDYDGNIRFGNGGYAGTGTAPDIGADEFEGSSPAPSITLTSVTPALTSLCAKSDRTIIVDVTTVSGTITGVVLNYSYNGVPQTPVPMTNTSGNSWSETILAPAPGNSTVTWSVTATNSLGISTTYNGASYADEPTTGLTATATVSPGTVCSGSPATLTAVLAGVGSAQVGAGATTSTTYSNPIYSNWANNKMQILYLASELSAAGILPGNLTALSMNLNSTSSTGRSNFTVNIANTGATALTTTFLTPGFTQVYTAASYVPVVGTNTFTFGTGGGSTGTFNWDGTSNIVIQICWDNIASTATESSNCTADNTPFVSVATYNRTSTTGTSVCGITVTGNNTYSVRPTLKFYGVVSRTASGINWSDGTSTVGTTNPLVVNPTVMTNYTAEVLFSGCPVTSNTVSVNVDPLPMAPVTAGSSQCGTQIPVANVTSNAGVNGSGVFNWYAASTGGTALQSGTSTTYNTAVSSTITFYVSETGTNGCESGRTAVTVTVGSAPLLTLSSSTTDICAGATSSTITVTSTVADFNSYTWSPSSNVSGNQTSGWTFNPSATTTYTLTANNSTTGCSNVTTLVVNVNPLPVISSVTPSVNPICEGSSTVITTTSMGVSSGNAMIGTASTLTAATAQPTAFCNRWPNYWSQTIFTAAELTAAGLVSGNITALSYDITTLGDAATNNNFTIKIGTTAGTNFASTTFLSTASFTNVYGPATYTHTASGLNTITFSTPFVWDGVSNIVVNVTHDGADLTNNSRTYYTATADNKTLWVNSYTGGTTTGTLSVNRLNTAFTGQVSSNVASSLNWSWTPSSTLSSSTGSAVTANPTSTTTYTVTATNPSTTCSSSQSVTITVNPQPLAPVNGNITQCGTNSPTPAVSYVTDPNAFTSPTFNWFTASTGGSAILNTTNNTTSPALSIGTNTFYVSLTNPATGCESARTTVTIMVNTPPALSLSSSTTTICAGTPSSVISLSSAVGSYDSYVWTSAGSVSGNETTGWTFNPSATTTYTLTANNSTTGCSNVTTLVVNVNPLPVITSVTPTVNPICEGSSTVITTTSMGAASGNAIIGTASTLTGATAQPTAFCNRWPNYWSQTIFTAAELTAAGLVAGNITALSYDITTLGDAATNNNFTIKIGTTVGTNFASTTFLSTASFTNVYGPATYTHTASGLNTITFSTPFVWDGVSNIVVNVTHDGADAINNSRTYFTATADNKTLWVNSYTGSTTTGTLSVNRLNTTFTGQVTSNIASSLNWSWTPSSSLSSSTGSVVTASPTSTTTYTVTATNPVTSCSSSQTVTIDVNPRPVVALGTDITQCGGTVTLDAGNTGDTYLWSDASTSQTLTVSASGTYSVTVTDAVTSCTGTDAITVTINPLPVVSLGTDIVQCGGAVTLDAGNAGSTYLWNDASTSQTLTVSTSGTYNVTVTDAVTSCTGTDAIDVTINALPVVSLGTDITQCGGTVTLDAGNTGATYLWSDASTSQTLTVSTSGTYSVTVTDAGTSCTGTDAIDVTINPLPVVALGTDIVQCGGTVTLDAGNTGATYLWSDASTAQTLTVSTSGTYSVTVNDATTSCTGTDAIDVTINSAPVVSLGTDITQCGGTVTLDAGNAGSIYLWSDASTSQTLTVSTSGTYSVTVTDGSSSCTGTDVIDVTINPLPSVTFTPFTVPVCDNGGPVSLTNGSPAGGIYSGTGVSGSTFDPTGLSGMVLLTYTVTDVNSCTNSDTASIMVDLCSGITSANSVNEFNVYPNPANGMINVSITNVNAEVLNISIVDLQGKEVYNSTNTNVGSSFTKQINIESLAKGVYYVKLSTENTVKINKLIVH